MGRQSFQAHPDVFRHVHLVFASEIPMLGATEDLHVLAHGATDGDDGEPLLGDAHDALYLNASTFWTNVGPIFPPGYRAGVYISACESADPGPGTDFGFATALAARLRAERGGECRVYGHKGSVGGTVPLPDDDLWIEAEKAGSARFGFARNARVGNGGARPRSAKRFGATRFLRINFVHERK
ncbi:hypothetical protein [Catenulispora yoronensis]|uniref:hypothetical protein n=1 Tax=Catenulispora yoronensis TaxID=450799 RepID=UPI0031CF13A2